MEVTTLDDLVSRTRLHLDLNGVQICEMSASVFDLLSDYPLEEVTIKGWHSSPMKLLEVIWDSIAWPDGGSLCSFSNAEPGLRILLQGPDDDPEGPIFCDICIHVRVAAPLPARRDDR